MKKVIQEQELQFAAKIVSGPSRTLEKKNGSQYCMQNIEFLEGPFIGKTVGAERTLLNSNMQEKKPLEVGTECIGYVQIIPDRNDPSKPRYLFTIGEKFIGATQEELDDAFTAWASGVNTEVANTTEENIPF